MQEPQQQQRVFIGDLLLRAHLVTQEVLDDSLALASRMHVLLGRVLSMQGHMTEEHMAGAEQITAMIEYGDLSLEDGIKAIQMIVKQGVDLKTALHRLEQATDT